MTKAEARSNFSIAMCTFNGRRFVGAQLQSFFDQMLEPAEIVVVDDGSTDGTIEYLHEVAARSPVPLRVEVNEERLGSYRNFERAISLCGGELIALSDQDDLWNPEKLDLIAAEFAADSALTAIFSDSELVDERLRPLGRTMFDHVGFDAGKIARLRRGDAANLVLTESFVSGATLAFRASLMPRILPFPPEQPELIHDRWIAVMACATGRLGVIPRPLVKYRQHGAQQIGAMEGVGLRERFSRGARRDGWDRSRHLWLLEQVRSWVDERADGNVRREFRAILDARIGHVKARVDLPEQRWRRLRPVARELARGNYSRFSSGSLSAAKDLLLP